MIGYVDYFVVTQIEDKYGFGLLEISGHTLEVVVTQIEHLQVVKVVQLTGHILALDFVVASVEHSQATHTY